MLLVPLLHPGSVSCLSKSRHDMTLPTGTSPYVIANEVKQSHAVKANFSSNREDCFVSLSADFPEALAFCRLEIRLGSMTCRDLGDDGSQSGISVDTE